MSYARLNADQAAELACCGRTKFYAKVKAGTYPKPIKDGRSSYWLKHKLEAAMAAEDQKLADAEATHGL